MGGGGGETIKNQKNRGMQQQYSDDDLDHSPFRGQTKKSLGSISNRHASRGKQ